MAGEHAPSMLELDLGFLAVPRRLWSSDWFRSLGAAEKLVVIDALMVARHSPGGEFWFAGRRIPLAIGQFIDSEEERARRCGVSRKVIRTTDRKMTAVGLIRRERAHPAGRCPFITTVLDYTRFSLRGDEPGPRTEPPPGQCGASNGPAGGQQGAPSEQGNNGKPGKAAGDLAGDARALTPGGQFQQRLAERLARTALYPVGGGATVLKSLEAALERIPVEEAVEACANRVFDAVAEGRRQPGTLAYFVQVLADLATERTLADQTPEAATGRPMHVPDAPAVEYES